MNNITNGELTLREHEFMERLKSEGILSVRELDSYSIMVAESLSYEKKILKVSTRVNTVYIHPSKESPFKNIDLY